MAPYRHKLQSNNRSHSLADIGKSTPTSLCLSRSSRGHSHAYSAAQCLRISRRSKHTCLACKIFRTWSLCTCPGQACVSVGTCTPTASSVSLVRTSRPDSWLGTRALSRVPRLDLGRKLRSNSVHSRCLIHWSVVCRWQILGKSILTLTDSAFSEPLHVG